MKNFSGGPWVPGRGGYDHEMIAGFTAIKMIQLLPGEMKHTSCIWAQQKKKKMAEKITKKTENVKPVLLESQIMLKPDNKNLKEGVDWKRVGSAILTRIHKLYRLSVKKKKNTKKSNISHFRYWCWESLLRTPHIVVDGTKVEVVDGASLNTWRASGDWVALHTITSRGSTQNGGRAEIGLPWLHHIQGVNSNIKVYNRVPKEVQGST